MIKNHHLKFRKNYQLLFFIGMLFLSFVFINIGSGLLFGRHKADLTDNGQYTLSPSSASIVKDIKSPIHIKVYLSQSLNKEYPALAQYSQFVLRFLENYQNLSPEMVEIEIKNPEPFSLVEKEAKAQGVDGFLSTNGQTNLYFGAVFSNDFGDSQTISRFLPERRGYLETDISRLFAKINLPILKKIGIVSDTIPILKTSYGKTEAMNWAFVEQLKNDYTLVAVSPQSVQIPFDLDALILINTGHISPFMMYALDQYIMTGGKILLLTDSYSEISAEINGSESIIPSNINKLLNNLGVSLDNGIVVGDLSLSETTIISNRDDNRLRNYPLWINIPQQYINQKPAVTQGLSRFNFKSAGALTINGDLQNPQITPLITTSKDAGHVATELVQNEDKYKILEGYQKNDQSYNLALLVEGKFDSLYPNNILDGTEFAEQMLPFIAHSIEPSEIIIIADTDILNEANWTAEGSADDQGAYHIISTNNNGDLILRSIDYLVGNHQLLGISNKNILDNEKTVTEEVYTSSYKLYSAEYEQTKSELYAKEQNTQYLDEAIADHSLSASVPMLKKIEQNKQDIQKLQDKLKYLDYIIRQESDKQINTIIIMNILILPFSIILLIWLINLAYARHQRKKVVRLVDEYKIS